MTVASSVYEEKQAAVAQLLRQIRELAETHAAAQAKRPLDWRYVGDLAHVEERLKEVRGFLLPEETRCG